MRIVVNDIAASNGGALSILLSFYDFLVESDDQNEWIFLLSDSHFIETNHIKIILMKNVKKSWLHRIWFEVCSGSTIINKLNADIFFSLQNTLPYRLKIKKVLYVHQSIPFQSVHDFSFFKKEEFFLAIYQNIIGLMIKTSIKRANFVVVQTKWMKHAVIKQTGILPHKIVSLLPPVTYPVPTRIESYSDSCVFFYPAIDEPYKNHRIVYESNKELLRKGVTNYTIYLTLRSGENQTNISYLGQLSKDEVFKYYKSSTLIFPSYIETIGLPLLEARKMGALILASDTPFSREALQGYDNAYYFDPYTKSQLTSLMEAVISGKIRRVNVADKKESEHNTWEEVVKNIINENRGAKDESENIY